MELVGDPADREPQYPLDVRISFPVTVDIRETGERLEGGGLENVIASMFGFVDGTIPDAAVHSYVLKFGGSIAVRTIVD